MKELHAKKFVITESYECTNWLYSECEEDYNDEIIGTAASFETAIAFIKKQRINNALWRNLFASEHSTKRISYFSNGVELKTSDSIYRWKVRTAKEAK